MLSFANARGKCFHCHKTFELLRKKDPIRIWARIGCDPRTATRILQALKYAQACDRGEFREEDLIKLIPPGALKTMPICDSA